MYLEWLQEPIDLTLTTVIENNDDYLEDEVSVGRFVSEFLDQIYRGR